MPRFVWNNGFEVLIYLAFFLSQLQAKIFSNYSFFGEELVIKRRQAAKKRLDLLMCWWGIMSDWTKKKRKISKSSFFPEENSAWSNLQIFVSFQFVSNVSFTAISNINSLKCERISIFWLFGFFSYKKLKFEVILQ